MIVCEGPDGAGKTTLCERICEHYELKMGERGTRNRDELWRCTREDTWRAIYTELQCDAPPLVWDRLGPWSDPVYTPVQGRGTSFTGSEINQIRDMFIQWRWLVVICLPPLAVVRKNVGESHQMDGVAPNINFIYAEYASMPGYDLRYDYTKVSSWELLTHNIDRYLRYRKERQCYSSSTPAVSASVPSQPAV